MVIGDPYKMAFILERMTVWEADGDSFRNGIMFLSIEGEVFPKEVRTTTFLSELPDILSLRPLPPSAFMDTVTDKGLYNMPSDKLLAYLEDITFPDDLDTDNDYRFLVPFTEIGDSGFEVFMVSDGENVRVLVGKWSGLPYPDDVVDTRLYDIGHLELSAETVITLDELEKLRCGLQKFYDSLK